MKLILIFVAATILSCLSAVAQAVAHAPTPSTGDLATLSARSTLVLVPTLVRTKAGEPVFTLHAEDFVVTDDGVEQKVTLEDDADGASLALVVAVQTGGSAAPEIDKYRQLGASIEAMVGAVPHRVAVVEFGGEPGVLQPFTEDMDKVSAAMAHLGEDEGKGAILDALHYSVALLRTQPPRYRRAILLISETVDQGSHLTMEEAVRAVSDSNTAIYSLAFASSKAEAKHEASLLNNSEPGPAHGCMSKDTSASADPPANRWSQAWDCLSQLAPPLRAAKILALIGTNAMRQNAPATVAQLTGGEYVKYSDLRTMQRHLETFANHVPNRYMLSFHPQSPHPGFHLITTRLKNYDNLTVTARSSYWANDAAPEPAQP